MSNLLKSLLGRKQASTEEAEAIERANQALKLRLQHYMASTHDRAAA